MLKIVCEGNTDKNKISEILEFLEIPYNDNHFIIAGNKQNLLNKDIVEYRVLKQEVESGIVFKILFLVDVDFVKDDITHGYENTQARVVQLRKDLDIVEISDYYLLCDLKTNEGYLESLLLSTVSDAVKKCFEELLECKELNDKHNHKNILEEFYRISKPDTPYDFNHPNFNELKKKLTDLFKENNE